MPRLLAADDGPMPLRALRWLARAASLVSLTLLALFATSGGAAPSGFEWLLLACFPGGVSIGMLLAWRHEILGGTIAATSLACFYALVFLDAGRPAPGFWFVVFAAPGLALFLCGIASAAAARRADLQRPVR